MYIHIIHTFYSASYYLNVSWNEDSRLNTQSILYFMEKGKTKKSRKLVVIVENRGEKEKGQEGERREGNGKETFRRKGNEKEGEEREKGKGEGGLREKSTE